MSNVVESNISAKQAAKIAIDYVESMYLLLGTPISDVMLEEVEPSEDDQSWQITVGFSGPNAASQLPEWAKISNRKISNRNYKVVQVNRGSGEIRSMKIRQIEAL